MCLRLDLAGAPACTLPPQHQKSLRAVHYVCTRGGKGGRGWEGRRVGGKGKLTCMAAAVMEGMMRAPLGAV